MIQIDNLSVQGTANGTIAFFGNVMKDLQLTYGTNADGWLNVINDLDDIIYADNLRSVGIDSTETALYQSYSIVNNRTHFSDRSNVDYLELGANIDTSSGVIVPHYTVLVAAKQFSGNITANAISLQTFISDTLDGNNTYSTSNVVSSKQFILDNGYVTGYSSIDSNSFDTSSIVLGIQDDAEITVALNKTMLVNNNFLE